MGLGVGRGVAVVAFVACLAAQSASVQAQSVADGRRQYLAADFRRAGATFDAVLASPRLTAGDALEAHRYLAALWLALRNEPNATSHAEAAVALDPAVTPPDGSPPETAAIFTRARAGRERPATLAIAPAGDVAPEQPSRVRATLTPAPAALASRLHLECHAGATQANRDGPLPAVELEITPPADATSIACRAAALTAAGASLFDTEESFDLVAPAPTLGDGVGDDDGSSSGSPWPWIAAGGGAALVIATVVLVVVATSGSDTAHFGSTRVEGW